MPSAASEPFNIDEIIEGGHVVPHFQPVVSMKRRAVVGFEGLSRGVHPRQKSIISPIDLFGEAAAKGVSRDLDRLCRRKILEDFQTLYQRHPELILSLNLDASAIDKKIWSGVLKSQVEDLGLSPQNIVIEIVESAVEDVEELQHFEESYRSAGFLIALDDVGAGHSNLNRIPLIKPDILKIDRYLVQNIHEDFYKQEVVKSLVSMARHLGTVIIAEGVETEGEASALLDMGVDLFQGYYFSRPKRHYEIDFDQIRQKLVDLGGTFKNRQIQKIGNKQFNMNRYHSLINEIQMELAHWPVAKFGEQLSRVAKSFPSIECLYVLNENGLQVTDMIFNTSRKASRRSAMFHPLPQGADHTMRDYFYFLMNGGLSKSTYVTKSYVSLTTGNICVTIGALFKDEQKKTYILCLDIHTPALDVAQGNQTNPTDS